MNNGTGIDLNNAMDSSDSCLSTLVSLISKLKEYNTLLGEELNEVCETSSNHHWESSRVESGEQMRKEIAQLEKSLRDYHKIEFEY